MTLAETLLLDFDFMIDNARKTLSRITPETAAKPHDKCMPMHRLAMHVATICQFGYYIVTDDGMDMATSTHPKMSFDFTTTENALAQLTETSARCREALAGTSDEALEALWPFRFGEMVISNDSRALSLRKMCFDHMIHHTAQLGVYLRVNGAPVPALFGPSADEQWSA